MAKVYTLLDELATNELEPGETTMMRQHLAECQTCSQVFVEIGQYHRLLRGVMSNDAPVSIANQVAEQDHARPMRQEAEPAPLPSQPRRATSVFRRTSTRLLIAAVVLVLIVADILVFRNVLPQTQHPTGAGGTPPASVSTTPSGTPTATVATTPTEEPTLVPNSPWHQLWTLPALPPPPSAAYGSDSPYLPQIAWSSANAQRLYVCRATINYTGMPAVLHDLYRSDDQGIHWTAYALPEAAANCRIKVDPTNADALVLQDDLNHSYISRDGGQHWQVVPDSPQWDTASLGTPPNVQIMAGRLYVEGYWTEDLTHWTRWYPVANEQNHVYVQINPQRPQTLYTAVDLNKVRCVGTPSTLDLGVDPLNFQAQLCRSDDEGQTWHFLAVVVGENASNNPAFCLALNHPETLYAWGYTAQSYPNPYPGGVTGDAMRSTDGGNTWTRLSGVFVGGDSSTANFHPCGADAYGGQSPVRVDNDNADQENNQWQNFGVTADGTIYHVLDMPVSRQGVMMNAGVSVLTDAAWSAIAPYPEGLTTPTTNYRLRMLLISPPAGSPVLLAFTDQRIYSYAGFNE